MLSCFCRRFPVIGWRMRALCFTPTFPSVSAGQGGEGPAHQWRACGEWRVAGSHDALWSAAWYLVSGEGCRGWRGVMFPKSRNCWPAVRLSVWDERQWLFVQDKEWLLEEWGWSVCVVMWGGCECWVVWWVVWCGEWCGVLVGVWQG